MKKRIVALLLCCVMLLTLSPSLIASASATDETPVIEQTEEPKNEEPKTEEPKTEEPKAEEPADPEAPTAPEEPTVPEEENTEIGISTVNFTDVASFLAPVTGNSTARRAAARAATTKDTGAKLDKKVTKISDTEYQITLEAFATGASTLVSSQTPTDIVLVLDQSGSMGNCIRCGADFKNDRWSSKDCTTYEKAGLVKDIRNDGKTYYYFEENRSRYRIATYCDGSGYFEDHNPGWYESASIGKHGNRLADDSSLYIKKTSSHVHRLDALTTALTTFATNVQGKATSTANHRIAIVGFSSSDYYHNTELLTGVTLDDGSKITSGSYYYYPNGMTAINGAAKPTTTQYEDALQDMSTSNGQQGVKAAIKALTASGGTNTNDGLAMAEKIFKNNPVTNDAAGKPTRNRVVILFTDGATDSNRTTTIQTAYRLKHGDCNATVYTVGVFDGADGTPVANWENVATENKFLHLLSSNYNNAQGWSSNNGAATYPKDGKSYYLSAGDENSLNNIFTGISQEVGGGTNTQLTKDSYILDTVTEYFDVPANTSDVKFYTENCTGVTTDGTRTFDENRVVNTDAKASFEGQTLKVNNFDFIENWCGTTSSGVHGKKLIIEFTITPKAGFLGGNGVPTNVGDTDGIYTPGGEKVDSFVQPEGVDVKIPDVTVSAVDKNVYLTQVPTDAQLKEDAAATCNGVNLLNESAYTGTNAWKAKFVTISTTTAIEHANFDATADGTYTLTAKVEPTKTGTATAKSASATGNINVFKPEVTFKDSQITLGESADYTKNLDGVVWKHGEVESTTVTMIGEKPELKYGYNPAAGIFKTDTPVKATVKIEDTDVTGKVAFKHAVCTIKDNCTLDAEDGHFIVHVKPLSLTIKKTGADSRDANQSFVFVVSNDRDDDLKIENLEVIVHGDGSVTLNGLPTGTYTVTEKESWSWRYTPTASNQKVELTAQNTGETIEFKNDRSKPYWLTGGAWCDNNWATKTASKSN